MKKYTYSCDGGSLLVGNPACVTHIVNGYGDGEFGVYLLDDGDKLKDGLKFITSIRGYDIKVYDYDCLRLCELEEHVLFGLTGRFGIYSDGGDIYIERWK